MIAYDYPLLGLFWTMILLVLWITWFMMLFRVIADIFRSRDMGGVAKCAWLVAVILVPFVGVLAYVIARGGKMARRDVEQVEAQEQAFQAYVRDAAGPTGTAAELTALVELRDRGEMTSEEFEDQKRKVLAQA